MGKVRIATKEEARQIYKQNIVFNMLQAARVQAYGSYAENERHTHIGNADKERYREYFMNEAFSSAMSLLREETFDIDCSVEDEVG